LALNAGLWFLLGRLIVPAPLKNTFNRSSSTTYHPVQFLGASSLNPPGGKAVTPEQMELSRVRAENARLRMENEILKKATAYFAKDAL
jgi:transposase